MGGFRRLKKAAAFILISIMCIALAACGASPTAKIQPTDTPVPPPVKTAPVGEVVSFAHGNDVYAYPEKYTGKKFAALFQIVSSLQPFEDKSVYYAKRLIYTGAPDTAYTILTWKGEIPTLSAPDIFYIWGTVKERKTITINKKPIDALLIEADGYEKDAAKADIPSDSLQYTFDDGKCAADIETVSGTGSDAVKRTFTLNINRLIFSRSDLTICTKTEDTSLDSSKYYHFDIILHQNGYFAWCYNNRFWMGLGSVDNYDYTPFPALDCKKDITAEFAPFDSTGKLICEPFVIGIKISGLKPADDNETEPTETATPSETTVPTDSAAAGDTEATGDTETPTDNVTPTGTVTPTEAATADGNGN